MMPHIGFVFPKLRIPKSWLHKCLKSPVSEHPWTSNMVNGPNTAKICITAHSSYLLITVKSIELEKVSLVIRQLGLFANILAANDKYPVLNIEKLMRLIQMQLSQKQNRFFEFLFPFLKCRLNLEYFEKKWWRSYILYFRNYGH